MNRQIETAQFLQRAAPASSPSSPSTKRFRASPSSAATSSCAATQQPPRKRLNALACDGSRRATAAAASVASASASTRATAVTASASAKTRRASSPSQPSRDRPPQRQRKHPQRQPKQAPRQSSPPHVLHNVFCNQFLAQNHLDCLPKKPRRPPASFPILDAMLSDDLVGNCFFSGYLDTFETVRLTAVCKRFQAVSRQSVRQLDLHGLSEAGGLNPSLIARLVSRFPCLESLDFTHCSHFGGDHLLALAPLAPSLKRLLLKGSGVKDDDIRSFFAACKAHLGQQQQQQHKQCIGGTTTASTTTCTAPLPTQTQLRLPLREIDLSATTSQQSTNITDAAVRQIAIHCPRMEQLRLGWCKTVTDTGISHLFCTEQDQRLKKQSHLKLLDISLTGVSDSMCRFIHGTQLLHNLRTLDVSATRITGKGLQLIAASDHRLEHLVTRHLSSVNVRSLIRTIVSSSATPSTTTTTTTKKRRLFLDVTHSEILDTPEQIKETTKEYEHSIQLDITK